MILEMVKMRERIKTFLLISLVGISLLFTKRLWIELPNEMLGVFREEMKHIRHHIYYQI